MYLATTPHGNDLLDRDPLALLIGMLLDQQVTMEKAFTSPSVLAHRLGVDTLDAGRIATANPDELVEVFATPPALHRYPAAMAQRTQALCRILVEEYGGRAEAVWQDAPDGPALVKRLTALPGFGQAKARIFVALLGKQRGVTPPGWREAAGDYGLDGFRSVADVVDAASLAAVREYKKSMKAAARAT